MQGQVQRAGWSSGCAYCRRYLVGYFLPSSSTWVNFRSGLEEPGRVTTRALLREWCEKSCRGMQRAPSCLLEVLQAGGKRWYLSLVRSQRGLPVVSSGGLLFSCCFFPHKTNTLTL